MYLTVKGMIGKVINLSPISAMFSNKNVIYRVPQKLLGL